MYHLALGIVYDLAALPASKEEEFIKEDNEQYSQIYFNLYLAAIQKGEKEKALDYNKKATDYNTLLYGDKSLNVSNNHYIQAQLLLKMGRPSDGAETMLQALSILEHVLASG